MTVYIVYERYKGKTLTLVMGVYATRKLARAEQKRLRALEPDTYITYPIVAYVVEGA